MASSAAKVSFRVLMVVLFLLLLFYVGRPLYWKISATIHDIRHNKQTVKQGTPFFFWALHFGVSKNLPRGFLFKTLRFGGASSQAFPRLFSRPRNPSAGTTTSSTRVSTKNVQGVKRPLVVFFCVSFRENSNG